MGEEIDAQRIEEIYPIPHTANKILSASSKPLWNQAFLNNP